MVPAVRTKATFPEERGRPAERAATSDVIPRDRRGEPPGRSSMADIFNEIDEELRQEKLRKAWDRWGVLVIVFAAMIVLAVAAWRGWDHWQTNRAREQGDQFAAAEQLMKNGDQKAAEAAFLALSKNSSGGYPMLAALRAASTLAETGETAKALEAFDALAKAPSVPAVLADIARVRAAFLAVDVEDRATFDARVAPLAVGNSPYRHAARELLALAAWKAGDLAAVKKEIDAIDADPETPRGLSDRAAVLSALVRAHTPSGKAN